MSDTRLTDGALTRTTPPELRITVALGAALLVQTALALIWAGGAAERVAQLERRVDNTDRIIERTARLEEQTRAMTASLTRIEAKLDQQAMQAME